MKLDQQYWEVRHRKSDTPWQLPIASPPLIDFMEGRAKQLRILIPGAGTGLEVLALAEMGFERLTVLDISPSAIKTLAATIPTKFGNQITLTTEDFFAHSSQYDIILEQTFFCALEPRFRESYAQKCHELLKPKGLIAGVLFNRTFENNPPFGGSEQEYRLLFSRLFHIKTMETCYNSFAARQGTELFFTLKPKTDAHGDSQS